MKQALIIGAGNIGRGVIGYLLSRQNYGLSFYDVNPEHLIKMKEAGGYSVFVADDDQPMQYPITSFEVIAPNNLIQALTVHDFIFCCVYEGAFKSIAENLAQALQQRVKDRSINIMLCVNSLGAPQKFRQFVETALKNDPETLTYFQEFVGINQVMVLSAALPLSEEQVEKNPYAVMITANPHLEIDGASFQGDKPKIADVAFVDNAEGRIYRKVYVGNMRHTMAAFVGAAKGFRYIYEAQQDPQIRPWLERAFEEAHQAILLSYSFDSVEDQAWTNYMQDKLDQTVEDPIQRVVANPEIKLGNTERFIGPAKLCLTHHILPFEIARGAAYGLRFLQATSDRSLEELLTDVCGLDREKDYILYQLIKKHAESIEKGA